MSEDRITDAKYAAALAAGRVDAETEFRASAVRYIPERDAIEIVTQIDAGFLIPRQQIDALRDASPEDLAKLEVWPDGSVIELPHRDVQIGVHGLLTAVLPSMLPARFVAGMFASRGGQATSEAKRRSARANGRRGGRPRKAALPAESATKPDIGTKTLEAQDMMGPGPHANPAFASLFREHKVLAQTLTQFSSRHLVATVGGLLTMPEWQASTLRLEVLQHLVVANSRGTERARSKDFKSWLTELGDGTAGRLEDPSEDVFTSRVLAPSSDYLVFEGIYEASAFHLQRFLNILEAMPSTGPYAELRIAVRGLLRLSGATAQRAGVEPFGVGQTEPIRKISKELLGQIEHVGERVTFSREDLNTLGIELDDLAPFVFDSRGRSLVHGEHLGHSTLERHPLVWIDDHLYLALPTAVSIAIRRFIIEFCLSSGLISELYGLYANEIAETFTGMPLLGRSPVAPALRFQKVDGIFVANLSRYIDEGRLLHFCFLLDDFDSYAETGTIGISPNTRTRMTRAIETSLAGTRRSVASRSEFRQALSLLVICPWGRPIALEFDGTKDERWRVESISAADLTALTWESGFSPLKLWRLLDARDALRRLNIELFNFNGLLNLYAWSKSLGGHLVPHGRLPDDHDPDSPLNIVIPQNGLLDIRRHGAHAGNVHLAPTWDGRSVRVRRLTSESFFEEDRDEATYASLDDLDAGRLAAVFETKKRGWWVSVETPNIQNRDLHYRLWHALTVWLARAADPLEEFAPALPDGPVAWICTFEDDEAKEGFTNLPTYDQAAALLEIETRENVVRVTAKRGFLASFRHTTNVGERLLVGSLITGALRIAGTTLADRSMQELMSRVVPNEWARDIHLFSPQRFRDLVRDHLPESILISKSDDAYSRIGLGWRARQRSEGALINGIDNCCAYLAAILDKIWEEMREALSKYNREKLVVRLVANHEAILAETDQWLRTARSLLALHADQEATTEAAIRHIAEFNAGSLSTRLVIEMALCESPEVGGEEAGILDIGRLLAGAMHMHHFGGSSEAIRYQGKRAEIRVTPLGDIHTRIDFEERIADPYGRALGTKLFRVGAEHYEDYFREPGVVESSKGKVDPEFLAAWEETFGFTIDDLRVFLDTLEDEGVRRNDLMFMCNFDELSALEKAGRISPQKLRSMLETLTLKPRGTWASTPNGFAPKDWHPWRFRRRLSVIARPILQITEDDDPRYLIAPGLVREGALKLIDYCLRGAYEAKDFTPGRMRSWIGAEENRRGHKFNLDVARRLEELGWSTRSNIRATEILNNKLDRDYGDFDVLAWRNGRVLAIECKDLERAMTAGEIARQLHGFLGVVGVHGKPDRLKRHLIRVELLRRRATAVKAFVGGDTEVAIEAHVVFSDIVPMHFSELTARHGVRFTAFDDLGSI